jgi:hypothetical protein
MADDKSHWGLIDHALVGLKLTNLAEEMHESIRAEIGQIQFDNLGNSNSQAVPTLIIAMHLRRTDEWIEETYRAYCEVWEKQRGKKTADFIRAVSANAIPVIISARTNAVIAELSGQCARTGSPTGPHNARMESFKSSMSRLATRWARKLEIEAKECEHSESLSRGKQHNEFDQRENLRKAIIGLRVEIERISRTLDSVPPPGSVSKYGQPIRIGQRSMGNLIRRRLEHEAALAELEREEARLAALEGQTSEVEKYGPAQTAREALPPIETQQTSPLSRASYRTPYDGLKPEMKVVDFSNAMLAARLTNKQYDCYSLVKEYQRPMNEVEQRMGVTRKTIHEHITAAENAMRKLSLKEYRAKAAAKHRHPE